jgi:hypothetical protein
MPLPKGKMRKAGKAKVVQAPAPQPPVTAEDQEEQAIRTLIAQRNRIREQRDAEKQEQLRKEMEAPPPQPEQFKEIEVPASVLAYAYMVLHPYHIVAKPGFVTTVTGDMAYRRTQDTALVSIHTKEGDTRFIVKMPDHRVTVTGRKED